MNSRRQFLSFLAASPLALRAQDVLSDPKDALNVLEFEEAMRKAVPIGHFAYMTTGVDDDATLRANREGFRKFQLRPRRLIDVSKAEMHTELLGRTWESPIYISACASQRAYHPEGELASARAAKAKNTLQMLSTVSSTSVEDVNVARGEPVWYQLYAPSKWESVEHIVRRVEAAGCPVLVLTVDQNGGRNTETQRRLTRADTRVCSSCHQGPPGSNQTKPMFAGLERPVVYNGPTLDWNFVDKLKKSTKMKLVLKGLETREDASLACDHGVDAIVVSNHGGRAEETGRGTIECLPEVIEAVRGRVPVMIDGGFRRGTDVFKALAMGARAVGIGRPYLWGLGAFGQPGVERVIEILRAELLLSMKQCGARSIAEINKNFLV